MRRILASMAGGVIIPIVFFILVFAIDGIGITFPVWVDEAFLYVIYWPLIPLSKVMQNQLAMPGGDVPRTGVFVAWLGIHYLTFALLTYVILWLRARRKFS
jgi:hypothetical protein